MTDERNEYDDLLASEGTKDEARTNLRASVIGALPTNPDQYAEAKRLAKTTGVPAPVVERNMDEVKKQATLNEYDALIERAPVTASKFQDREFAKLAHDERDQLADLEDFIKKAPGGRHSTDMSDALKRGVVQLGVLGEAGAYGLDRMLTAIGKRFLPEPAVPGGEVDASSGQVKASLVEVANLYSNLPRDKRTDFAGEIVNRAAAEGKTLRGIGDAIAYIATPGGAMGALNYLIEMTPSAAVGGGIGGLAAKPIAAAVVTRIVAPSVAAGVVTPGAGAASQVVARGITAGAVTGVGTTTNAFPAELAGQISEGKEVDEALGYAGTKAAVEGLVNAPFGFVGGMLPLGATLTGKVGNIVGQAGLQGTGGAVGATAAAASVGEEITPGEAFLEAFFELASAPSDIAIAAATDVAERRNTIKVQADQATAAADHLTKIMQAAAASRTRVRDPETFEQLVQDAAEASGTSPTEVFIDAQPLVDTLQKAGMTEAQIREMLPSVAEQLDDEYDAGGSVAIPIGEAVTAFAGSGAEADLVRFARTTEDGYSVADSEQALAELEEMDADAQRIIAEQQDADAWAQSAQAVEDTIFTQLDNATWFSSDVNRTKATLLRNYYVVQADVMGITPEELYRQFPLTVSGVAPTGQVLNRQDGVDEAGDPEMVRRPAHPAFDFDAVEEALAAERETFVDILPSQQTPLQKALYDAYTTSVLDPDNAAPLLEVALENGRLDLAQYIVTRSRRYADSMSTTPGTSEGSPKYAAIKADLEARKAAAEAAVKALEQKLAERMGQQSDAAPTTFDQEVKGTTPYAADTIEVDGKTRPVVNNKGQRIAQTEEGLRNFWRWFGESKVVDAEGRPLVVYHGSDSDIEVFKTDGQGKTTGAGVFFTSNPAVASTYTQPARGGNISPVYLKIESSAELDAAGSNWNRLGKKTKVSLPAVEVSDQADENLLAELEGREPAAGVTKKLKARKTTLGKLFPDEFVYDDDFASTDDIARWARKQGYDGLAIVDVVDRGPSGRMHTKEAADPGALFVAFTDTQIKSIFNRGTYDGSDPNTLHQSAYSDEEIDFLVADGSLSPEQAATLKADAKNRGQNADARIAGADRRAQQGTGTAGRPTGQVYGRTVAGTSPRSGWEAATRVRGADGQPRRTYRGSRFGRLTAANFADDQLGLNSTHPSAGLGVWFSTDQSDAASYGEVSEQFLDLRNPKVFGPSELPAFDSIEQSIAFREALRAKGHDGIALDYRSVGGPVQLVAFDPEQVVEPAGELYQSGVEQEPRDLYVGHNITAEKIRHALDLGGLPAPSLGVGRTTTGGFGGFGDITLLAPKEILESDGARTFNADVYSPRQPRPVYKPDPKRFDALLEKLRALPGGFSVADIDEVGRYGADALARSDAVKLLYLTETEQAPKIKQQKVSAEIKKAAKLPYADRSYSLRENPDFAAIAKKYYSDAVEQMAQAGEPDMADQMRSHYFEDDGEVTFRFIDELARKVSRYVLEGGVDTGALRQDIAKKLRTPAQSDAFEKWVKDLAAPILGDKKLEISPSRRIPYTLDNVTAQMIKELRGGEGFDYGAGNIRAMVAAELDSVQAVQNRREEIVSGADMQKAKEESQQRLSDTLDDLKPFYKYDANGWGYMDDASRAIAEGPKGWREAFKLNAESEKIIRDYISYVKNLPTEYFETKMQRSVDLSEFTVAIVPKGTPQDVVAALEGKGLTIKTYDPKKPNARMKAIKAVDAEQDILFQNQPGKAEARGSFDPTTLSIALREKADLSTFLHEAMHFFFEMQATIAARPDAPARIVDDVNTLLKAVGFKGTAAEWLAQPLDARREAHEKVAETFEQYLITGEAPTVELQGLFNQMRAWMLSAYKTLKQFFAANKRAGLSAEVVGVFDRLLASDTALAETKRVRAMSPLFKSAEEAGVTAEGWAAYQADAGQMDADARRDLDARQVRGMKWMRTARSKRLKELQADASAKRRDVRIEARRRLLQEPVYRAMQFLRGKVEKAEVEKKAKGLDTRRDDLLTAIAKLGGLNKDLVVAEWGIDPKDFAKSPVFGKPILRSGKAGLSPDGMAEALAEVGYLQPKDGDRYALSDFEAMFNDSARGIQHYSLDADYDLIHGYKTLPVAADLGEQPFAAGRLSRPDLEARFANSDVDWQRLGVGRRGMIAEVGMDADAVANIVGFNTGEEMVKALLAAEPLQDATEALTDQIMLERYGDITSPEGLQRAADAALANDAYARMLATEYVRLNKAVGSPRAVQLAAKEAAERTVDRQAVRLARPDKSTAAAARAGKATEKAHAAGNLDEAAGFKRNQILNTAIARAQRELRAFVDKAQGDFAKMFGKDDHRAKTRDMNLVNLARAALAQYGLAPDAGGMKALQYLELVTQYDPALAENLKSMLAAMPEGKDFRDLTAGEFRTVASLVRGMWEMSRRVKQITIDGKKVEIDAAADELVAAVTANNGGKQGDLPGYSGTTTTADDLRVGALGIKSMLTRVEQWADFMGPAFKRFIWQPVSEAVTRYRVRRNEMVKQYRDLLKTIESDLTFHKIHAPELGMGGFTFNAGKSEVLHAILHSGNESNLRKLLLGRGWATVDEAGNLDTSRWDAFVKRMAAEGVITRADMDFVQGVWDLLETVKGDAQKAHRELYGYYFNEVTATPFVDPFGVERRGGYVPALADGLSSPDAMQKREQEELLHAGNSFMFPSTGKGFTQSRVEYNRPLELDLRTIGSHLDKVTRFAYIEPAVRDVGKLLINKRVARALNGYDQTIISQMLNPWLQRAARQTVSVPGKNRWTDKFCNGLRSRSGVVIMFANVVNTLQQITGFSVAALKVPAPALLRAAYMVARDPKRMAAEAAALAPWLAERMAGQSFEMQQEIKNILVNPNPLVKGIEFLKHNAYFLQQAMQNMMDLVVWWGAYDNAVANGANQRDAIRASNEAVRTTQGTFAPEDVSAFESNTAFVLLFSQFYGYFNMLASTLGLEAKKAIRDMGYGAATPRLLFIWFAGLALPAVVGEIIARGLPDDEDDEDGDGILDEWLALFFGSQGRTLAAMAPGLGQGVTLAFNMTDDKVYNDRLSISPGLSMAETTVRGGVNLLQGEVFDERLTKAEVRDTLTLIGMATGAPTGALARSAGYLVDVENGRADPENPVEFAVGLTTGR